MPQKPVIDLDILQKSVFKEKNLPVDFSLSDIKDIRLENGDLVVIKQDGSQSLIKGFSKVVASGVIDFIVFADQSLVPISDLMDILGEYGATDSLGEKLDAIVTAANEQELSYLHSNTSEKFENNRLSSYEKPDEIKTLGDSEKSTANRTHSEKVNSRPVNEVGAIKDVADAPFLSTSDSTGDEDTAIALNIDARLTDNSEVLSIVISGVPTGASLSAGTNNGDGSWTLVSADLKNLTITPAANDSGDLKLTVSAKSQDADDSATMNSTINVNVTAVADIVDYSDNNTALKINFASGSVSGGNASGKLGDADGVTGSSYNDKITGDSRDNVVNGGAGNDIVKGGAGNDTLSGDAGKDNISGGDGNDIVNGGDDADKLYGNDGDDTLSGDAGKDNISGGDGNDIVNGGDDADKLYGNDGDDILNGDGGNDILDGGDGNDILNGGEGNDRLLGRDGDDILNGGAGKDVLYGQNGNDTISGGDGKDKLYGDKGDDVLSGGSGDDALYGGDGDDILSGGSGKNKIDGGKGNDTVDYSEADGAVSIDLSKGSVTDSAGSKVIMDSVKNVENAKGSDYDDTIIGDKGDNILSGGKGSDNLTGGKGADTFVLSEPDGGIDVITDFDYSSGDRIDVSALVDVGEGESIDDYLTIVESDGNTHIQIDTDGVGDSSAVHEIAIIKGVVGLDLSSIISTDDTSNENG